MRRLISSVLPVVCVSVLLPGCGVIVVADVLLTGLIGVIIDAATGAWSKLSPETATVSLTKIGMVSGPDTITVGIKVGHTRDANLLGVQSSEPGVMIHVEPV